MQCHQCSGLAAKYQQKQQPGDSLERAITGVEPASEINLVKQIYKGFAQSYNPCLFVNNSIDQCAKSFATLRENECS
jgi:hypothetical protein